MAISGDDLIVRTESNAATANTWITYDAMQAIMDFRFDAPLVWGTASADAQARAMASAYEDLARLNWSSTPGLNQSRDYEFGARFAGAPPLGDTDFMVAIGKAQAAQVLFIIQGTQVREMARAGIRLHRALTGAEMEFPGYRGAVCAEAKELLASYFDEFPVMKRMR